jgi:hypothetical protein
MSTSVFLFFGGDIGKACPHSREAAGPCTVTAVSPLSLGPSQVTPTARARVLSSTGHTLTSSSEERQLLLPLQPPSRLAITQVPPGSSGRWATRPSSRLQPRTGTYQDILSSTLLTFNPATCGSHAFEPDDSSSCTHPESASNAEACEPDSFSASHSTGHQAVPSSKAAHPKRGHLTPNPCPLAALSQHQMRPCCP